MEQVCGCRGSAAPGVSRFQYAEAINFNNIIMIVTQSPKAVN